MGVRWQAPAPRTVADVLDALDQRLAGLTGAPVHRRTLVLLSVVGLGAWRSWTHGLGGAMISGWRGRGFEALGKRPLWAPPRRDAETRWAGGRSMHGPTRDTLGWSAGGGCHPPPWSLWPGRDSRSRQRREETAATRPTARGCTGSCGREDA